VTTTHEPQGSSDEGSGPAAEPAGTVAEEAALLVELLSRRGWGAGGGMPSASSQPAGGQDEEAASGNGPRPGGIPAAEARQAHECTCGGREPAACRVCPVCQLISFVQQVNPDTIERVADFVGFAATALRDLATAQRERSTRSATSNSETSNEEQEGRA
jgi:hypothetical protein